MIRKMLKVLGIILLVIVGILVLGIVALLLKARHDASIPIIAEDYQATTSTGGEIEAKYLVNGGYEVSEFEAEAGEVLGKYLIFYPSELDAGGRKYPVIVYCNGSGVTGHSQGDVSVFNTLTGHEHSGLFKTVVAVSPHPMRSWRRG